MDFEWDEAKRQANILKHRIILKHGIDFVDAMGIFAGRFIETEDLRRNYGERRYRVVGQMDERIIPDCLHVAWRAPPHHKRREGESE